MLRIMNSSKRSIIRPINEYYGLTLNAGHLPGTTVGLKMYKNENDTVLNNENHNWLKIKIV